MLGRKYTFETKRTRVRRLIVSGVFISIVSITLLAALIAYIPIYARLQKARAADAFFQKSPDAIAVFTGDKGRIAYATELLKKNPTSKLFISGVYAANSFKTILDKQVPSANNEELSSEGLQIDLDYESKNTFENVRETAQYLKKNPQLSRVLIISSDYHIMRVKLIISHFMEGSDIEFYFDSVPNSFTSWRETRKLLKEAVKITRTFVLLKIFGEEVVSDDY